MIYLYKANGEAPFLTQIGPIDLNINSVSDFSPSPDGDLAVVLYDNSFAGLLDVNVAVKLIKTNKQPKISLLNLILSKKMN